MGLDDTYALQCTQRSTVCFSELLIPEAPWLPVTSSGAHRFLSTAVSDRRSPVSPQADTGPVCYYSKVILTTLTAINHTSQNTPEASDEYGNDGCFCFETCLYEYLWHTLCSNKATHKYTISCGGCSPSLGKTLTNKHVYFHSWKSLPFKRRQTGAMRPLIS